MWLDLEAGLHRLLGQQACGQQHAGVGGVGAAGDGGNQHVSVFYCNAIRCRKGSAQLPGRLVKSVLAVGLAEQAGELCSHLAQLNAVLRTLGAGQTGGNLSQVQPHDLRVINIPRLRHAKQALRLEVSLKSLHLDLRATRAREVIDRLVVHGKETHGGAVFGGHVGNCGAVRQGQCACAFAKKFDKLAHHLVLAQDLGHGQHQIGSGHTLTQATRQFEAHNVGREEIHRLAQHGRFGLNATAAPAHYANAVDHGGVTVGTYQGVRVINTVRCLVDATRQKLQIHLVHDAKARWHNAKRVKGLHAPLHELVALAVALEFQLHVQVQ